MTPKKTTFDNDLPKIFGPEYAEAVRANSVEYLVKMGISSGLKSGEFNTERIIAESIKSGNRDNAAALVVALQQRELDAIQCRQNEQIIDLLQEIVKLAKQ